MNNLNFKEKLPAIFVGVIIAVMLALAFFGGKSYQKKVSSVTEEYLQQQVEEAQTEIERWKSRYDTLFREQTTLLLSVDSLEYRIQELKKNHAQKITIVKSYSNPELEQFFTERYGNL